MSFSRNAKRVWWVAGLLVTVILCQGQMCASTTEPFKIVGSPDPSMDGTYTLVLTTKSGSTNTAVVLTNGIPTSLGTGDNVSTLDGASHNNPASEGSTYKGTGDAGRQGSSFTMKIELDYLMPGQTPSSATQTLTFTGTIAGNGSISGEGTQTVSAPGYSDDVVDYTFTMTP